MALIEREEDDEWWRSLPISVHTHVLGVDITVYQRAMYEQQETGKVSGGLPADIEIEAYGEDGRQVHIEGRSRKYLAAWARRNLFEGAKPK